MNRIFRKLATQIAILGGISIAVAAPMTAQAQTVTHWVERQTKTSDRDKGQHNHNNNWSSLAFVGAGVAVVGLLTHEPILIGLGLAGGLYSTYRYDQDRRSHNAGDRRRYAYFSQRNRTIHGHRYRRVTVMQNGHHYYAYKRA